MFFDTTLFVI